MFESCLNKQKLIKEVFSTCQTEDLRYQKLIEWGRQLPKLKAEAKTSANIVKGCQSVMYLHSYWSGDGIVFEAESDALVSAGLAAILVRAYSGESPEAILKCPPTFLEDLGISASLTPNRANGLYSIHLRMKQDALKLLIEKESKKT
jgi:cysteine desulfuration protein SufE